MTAPAVGLIGLGLMGEAFAERLHACGHNVIGYDLDPSKVARSAERGNIQSAASSQEVAAQCEIVLVCVVSTDAVREVVFGPSGVSRAAHAQHILVDLSTTIVADTRAMAERLAASGTQWVDAPVSGGPQAARSGTLAIMAGGQESAVKRVRDLLNCLAAEFTHMGDVGAGQVTKMINQVLVLNNYCVIAEGLALAEACGIDAAKIPQALSAGHAGSNLLNALFPRMINRDYAPSGYARQALKDLDMVHDLARSVGVPNPMSSQAASLYRMLVRQGHSEKDSISVLKLYAAE